MKTNFIHFYFLPTLFCNKQCPYCLNSDNNWIEFNVQKFKERLIDIEYMNKKLNKHIVFEFNGGEFSITKNLFQYFEIFKEFANKNKIYNTILTTNFTSSNQKYLKILDILNNTKIENLNFFVTIHYDYNEDFLKKIYDFINNFKHYTYKLFFRINLIHGLPLIEKNFKKLKQIEIFKKLLNNKYIKIVDSFYIPKVKVDQGIKYLIDNKKLCDATVLGIKEDSFHDLCREKEFLAKNLLEYMQNIKPIVCNKTCPNQLYSEEIFKPKILSKNKQIKHVEKVRELSKN